ncbi:MAG: hypothetical protein A2015_11965 [Spirochaetes bacterium GWF1_31_7]|nr:MAG: hypothetical protein A2Y30_15110 [Spirochaetes bacterium GWE1_32_154]OHD49132.1 MAG: hypothetical protein A2015_11965 [Spirochaetes bacterium GWF1_31_7]OHD50282.1 MAG: hypothetical protein A2Y29_13160 [Spirochaetes bacterium GWE2_31_10]HBD93933.1 hypothetical protein [Spirochaetia bacterium]HBI38759.1 hypothetical protein [Spirochaetia bacterium]
MYNLDTIRKLLIELEDTIIFSIIERGRHNYPIENFATNLKIFCTTYEQNAQIFDYFNTPENIPFFIDLPNKKSIINDEIFNYYITSIAPQICYITNHSLTTDYLKDVNILNLLSKRIHSGLFVAISKFQSDTERYQSLIDKNNSNGIMTLLTDLKTEDAVIERVGKKAEIYANMLNNYQNINYKNFFKKLYFEFIIPLTKEVELNYLLSLKTGLDS